MLCRFVHYRNLLSGDCCTVAFFEAADGCVSHLRPSDGLVFALSKATTAKSKRENAVGMGAPLRLCDSSSTRRSPPDAQL